ncbi:MAG: S1 RNA-binding domain-containing protein [Planctomycetota bacterium]|nr:S1 RNA-binding domain-containing protein [Planctomycetota bacterium]
MTDEPSRQQQLPSTDDSAVPESAANPEPPPAISTPETTAEEPAGTATAPVQPESAPEIATDSPPGTAAAESEKEPAATTDVDEAAEESDRREIKIGSQREGSLAQQIKAQPQNLGGGPDVAEAGVANPATDGTMAAPLPSATIKSSPPPQLEANLSPEMQQELDAALADIAIDDLIADSKADANDELTEESRVCGKVMSIRNENIFLDLGGRHQGVLPAKQFEQPPEIGTELDAVVSKFNAEDGFYELILPDTAIDVGGWEDIGEGMVVDAVITGHNKGGLECEVNRLRGFIPMSQVATYRVEDVEEFVGQRFPCVVTEVKPERRNLVLSRRAMLERERAEQKKQLLEELQVGEIREGTVTRLQPFGAFVDLGGVDGLIHISQLSWDRVNDPSEVLEVGQSIKVKINKIDPETGKIGLGYRETFDNPWTTAEQKYKPKTSVSATVSKLMDFGAFVKLEPGIEGLIHISELAHRRVFRTGDVVSEGQQVEVMILSVDVGAQRIALSLKALEEKPLIRDKKKEEEFAAEDDDRPAAGKIPPKNLKGGTTRRDDGEQFGLKW